MILRSNIYRCIATELLILSFCSFAQGQILKTALKKQSKSFIKSEAKVLAKEGAETANKVLLTEAFVNGSEEISKDYVRKASAKQLVRSAVRKNLLKEIETKELGSILRYSTMSAKKELANTEKSQVKYLAHAEAKNHNYNQSVSNLRDKIFDKMSETILSSKIKKTLLYKELTAITAKGSIKLSEKDLQYLLNNPKQLRIFIKQYTGNKKGFQEFFIRLSMGDKKQVEALLDNPEINRYIKQSIRRSGEGSVHEWLMTKNFKDFLLNPKWGEDGPYMALALTRLVQKTENVLFKTGGGHVSRGRINSTESAAFHNGLSKVISKCSSKEEVFVAVKRYAKENLSDEAYKEFQTIFKNVFKTK